VAKDHVLTFDDVELPADSLCVKLYQEQLAMFPASVPTGVV
jgi:predicted homoserine dehydrogenase-like protein